MDKGSSPQNGTDSENNNVEEVEIWERLSIIHKNIDTLVDIPIVHAGEVETKEPIRIIRKGIDLPTSEEDTLEQE